MKEKWKWIRGYKNKYKVSSFGRVKSVDRYVWNYNHQKLCKHHFAGRMMHFEKNNSGYYLVHLSNPRKNCQVHRLVAKAFIPNPCHYPEVNHINEVKTNNKASNLEWCTAKYNTNYGTGRFREALESDKPVILLKSGEHFYFHSMTRASKFILDNIDVSPKLITIQNALSAVKRGRRKHVHGYRVIFK